MKRIYNNPKYRAEKRLVAFVNPQIKKLVEADAKKQKRSISNVIGMILEQFYDE